MKDGLTDIYNFYYCRLKQNYPDVIMSNRHL